MLRLPKICPCSYEVTWGKKMDKERRSVLCTGGSWIGLLEALSNMQKGNPDPLGVWSVILVCSFGAPAVRWILCF